VSEALATEILAALPQTQCTRCGYPDCAAYAQAVAYGEAAINRCPPGGAEGIQRLAVITGRPLTPLNPDNGLEGPRVIAIIDENWCIGCTLCIDACPTDAIIGTNKMMHTVIEPHCTGCELCLPVCPVDCISLENVTGALTGWSAWSPDQANEAKKRYDRKRLRLAVSDCEKVEQSGPDSLTEPSNISTASSSVNLIEQDKKSAVVNAALARARARKLKR
jgi:Na+-translocating ferredoxin:NAD+ oxidoreductase subunit B